VKKSSRLLSTILAAAIVLATVTVGFSVFAELPGSGLPEPDRDFMVDFEIALAEDGYHTGLGGTLSAQEDFELTLDAIGAIIEVKGIGGGFKSEVKLVADIELYEHAGAPDILWSPTGGYLWEITGDDGYANTGKGKSMTIGTAPGVRYDVKLTITDYDWVQKKDVTIVKNAFFLTPDAATDKSDLEEFYKKAFASSAFGYFEWAWAPFTLARTNAYQVLNNPSSTQDEVDYALEILIQTYGILNDNPDPFAGPDPEFPDEDADTNYNPPHEPTVKAEGFYRFFLMIWESIRYAVWDMFLSKLFLFGK